jgi:hypothetical protein
MPRFFGKKSKNQPENANSSQNAVFPGFCPFASQAAGDSLRAGFEPGKPGIRSDRRHSRLARAVILHAVGRGAAGSVK